MRTYTLPCKTYRLLFLLFIGSQALWAQPTNYVANIANADKPGYTNVLIGPFAGNATMTGSSNIFLGYDAGSGNTSGAYNTFIGGSSGFNNSTGIDNLFIGYRSGFSNTIGGRNEFLGTEAGTNNTSGQNNTFMGFLVGHENTTGSANVFLGNQAGFKNTDGASDTFIGDRAGYSNTVGGTNVFIGSQAGYQNTESSSNTFMGDRAGYSNTIGGSNVFIGNLSGYNNINGQANMFLGPQAGSNNKTGSYNVFLGNASANANTTGSDNTAIGAGSAAQNTTGQRNVFIGEYAGFNSQTGNDNVFIGFASKAGTVNPTNLTNAVAIGANAIVSQSNSVVLGANASVGIGTSAPKNKLEITQGTANQSGLRLTNLTSASPASLTNQTKFLTVNDQGDVILGSLNGSGRLGVSESLWERKGSILQSLQGEAIIIGSKVVQTPTGYKLFVEDGILTEKVKVAVKNTAEWSDKVFAPNYALRPLAEVAQYISTHQHLPGVPSAQEMVEQGNDLHKTDAKLLEKIEELTLYSIQLEKQLEATKREQQAKIDKLERLVNQLLDKK